MSSADAQDKLTDLRNELNHQRELLRRHEENLRQLQIQKTAYGAGEVPVILPNQITAEEQDITDIKQNIADIEQELAKLRQGSAGSTTPKLDKQISPQPKALVLFFGISLIIILLGASYWSQINDFLTNNTSTPIPPTTGATAEPLSSPTASSKPSCPEGMTLLPDGTRCLDAYEVTNQEYKSLCLKWLLHRAYRN